MSIMKAIKQEISGEPRLVRRNGTVALLAAHREPQVGHELQIALRLAGWVGAAGILVSYYAPETSPTHHENNPLIELATTTIIGLLNAVERLAAIVAHQSLDVPLESLTGWGYALLLFGGVWLFRHSWLLDLMTWLDWRESVTITVGRENLGIKHGVFHRTRFIARDGIKDVLILTNHRTGHDVMLSHTDGLLRLASIYGDLTRPMLFKLLLEQALAETAADNATETTLNLQEYNLRMYT